jgi:hypothetical protein
LPAISLGIKLDPFTPGDSSYLLVWAVLVLPDPGIRRGGRL